jgi:RNase P subunit RPR2
MTLGIKRRYVCPGCDKGLTITVTRRDNGEVLCAFCRGTGTKYMYPADMQNILIELERLGFT